MKEEIQEIIDRYETLAHKLNHMSLKAPLRFKVEIYNEMAAISDGLKSTGLWQDDFGKWH